MFTTQPKTLHTQSGFSLIEVLVAISLLLIALVGPMTFFARSSQSTEVANDRAIATFLAQEGAELIQKMRDDRTLEFFTTPEEDGWSSPNGDNFLADVSECIDPNRCGVSINDTGGVDVISCSGNSCLLLYDENAGRARYNHNSGDTTPYTRTIQLRSDPADNREVEITSRVEWDSTSLIETQSVEVQTTVFNVYVAN